MEEAKFPSLYDPIIIAMKGLPCTGKSEIARLIGHWARCSVFCIDDFLSASSQFMLSGEGLVPSAEEAERIHRLAFDALCKSAFRYLHYQQRTRRTSVVVIKSRLCSTFELDRLLQLSREPPLFYSERATIIVIECHIKNEHRLFKRLDSLAANQEKEWYKAKSRLDFEKARDDWLSSTTDHAHNWDLHLSNLINADKYRPARVIRLVLDPFDDFGFNRFDIVSPTPTFRDAIRYLVTRHSIEEVDWIGEEIIRDRYYIVQFDKLRRYLAEQELQRADRSGHKSKHLCPTSRLGKCCIFKTYTKGEEGDDDYNCGVCDKRVVSSEGYTCHFCFLTLHNSCAEHQGVVFPADFTSNRLLGLYPDYCYKYLQRTYACKSCTDGGKHFSNECNACLFQTHLKCRKLPTIIKHDSHREHFLSLQVGRPSWTSFCKACGGIGGKYGCYVCELYYCLACGLRPGRMEHTHGGHEHVLELVYTRDGMEPEEDYWCGVCYKDIDPQHWFYSCSDCPCYEAHPNCIIHIETPYIL